MNTTPATPRLIIRCIVILYLFLFLCGLVSSAYLLSLVTAIKPIVLISLLKYLLLCVLFTVLIVNTIKAISLKASALYRLAESTKNFKWLFCIAITISIAAKSGLVSITAKSPILVSWMQISLLTALAIFCFCADAILQKEEIPFQENNHADHKKNS